MSAATERPDERRPFTVWLTDGEAMGIIDCIDPDEPDAGFSDPAREEEWVRLAKRVCEELGGQLDREAVGRLVEASRAAAELDYLERLFAGKNSSPPLPPLPPPPPD